MGLREVMEEALDSKAYLKDGIINPTYVSKLEQRVVHLESFTRELQGKLTEGLTKKQGGFLRWLKTKLN